MFVKLKKNVLVSSNLPACVYLIWKRSFRCFIHLLGEVFIAQPGNRSESTEILLKNVPFLNHQNVLTRRDLSSSVSWRSVSWKKRSSWLVSGDWQAAECETTHQWQLNILGFVSKFPFCALSAFMEHVSCHYKEQFAAIITPQHENGLQTSLTHKNIT